ncbi:hypothetical protein EYF80_067846 [Liparis tanakae]|uniref:Uncharacterized protein n=1 Tax=Liparis tanakae TaxID=230148 RepID=A0A4Z2DZS0_9TELE|nr:hypothetical protein EYF80_067846 [Liparis tanakae]
MQEEAHGAGGGAQGRSKSTGQEEERRRGSGLAGEGARAGGGEEEPGAGGGEEEPGAGGGALAGAHQGDVLLDGRLVNTGSMSWMSVMLMARLARRDRGLSLSWSWNRRGGFRAPGSGRRARGAGRRARGAALTVALTVSW